MILIGLFLYIVICFDWLFVLCFSIGNTTLQLYMGGASDVQAALSTSYIGSGMKMNGPSNLTKTPKEENKRCTHLAVPGS